MKVHELFKPNKNELSKKSRTKTIHNICVISGYLSTDANKNMDDFLLRVLPSILAAILSAWLSALWAFKKFKAEKWWDRREKAYSEIINALYDLVQYFGVHKEDYGEGTGYSKDKEVELYQKYEESYWALKKATDIGSFYISKKAQQALVELSKRERLSFDKNPSWDVYEQDFQYHQDVLENFIKIAKSDLGASKA